MILIRGGRVYDPAGDTDSPALRDVLIEGDTILAVSAPDADGRSEAAGRSRGLRGTRRGHRRA